jgi:hypothetical protein
MSSDHNNLSQLDKGKMFNVEVASVAGDIDALVMAENITVSSMGNAHYLS